MNVTLWIDHKSDGVKKSGHVYTTWPLFDLFMQFLSYLLTNRIDEEIVYPPLFAAPQSYPTDTGWVRDIAVRITVNC